MAVSVAFGVFSDRISTEDAVENLKASGFSTADIVALFPDQIPTLRISPRKRRNALRGVAAGGGAGMVIGGVLEWIAGAGVYTLAGLGAMVSIGAGGSFIGAWAARRSPDYENRYEGRVRRGDILISVRCANPNSAKKAKEILKRAGGDDVSSTSNVPLGLVWPAAQPITERTVVASPVRLVVSNRNPERAELTMAMPRESESAEIHKKSVAS